MRTPNDSGQPCPHPEGADSRRMQQGHVSAIATYLTQSGKRRLLRCRTCAHPGKRGRPRKPLCAAHPDLVSGPLITQQHQGKLRTRSPRVVLGAERLTHLGCTISTALGERVNLTLRQALAPLARKTSSFCTDRERLRQRVAFCQAFYNVARPPRSVRQPLALHERTRHGAVCP